MANTRLFDSWQIGMDLPVPFDRAIDGGVRYSTKEEDCSCYNKATRGKKATLFPVVLRAVLNLMRGGLNDGNIAAFYCMEYTKAYQGKEMDCVIIYNPKNGRFKEGIIATPELGTAFSMEMKDQHMAVPLPVLAGQNTGEKLVALLAYASIEEDGPLFDAEFHYYYQQLKAMHDNSWIFEEAAKKEKKSLELKGIAQYMDIKELSRPIVEELVDVIYFYDPEHIEVVWNFKDDLPDYTK